MGAWLAPGDRELALAPGHFMGGSAARNWTLRKFGLTAADTHHRRVPYLKG